MKMTAPRVVLLFAGLLAGFGCQGSMPPMGTVAGKVTFKGEPVTTGQVQFFSDKSGAGASAALNDAGEFTFAQPIPAGSYQAHIGKPPAPPPVPVGGGKPAARAAPLAIPTRYQQAATSGLQLDVKEGPNILNIDLQP